MIVIDIIIAVLLVVTIWYCLRLNSKIVELQRGKKDLAILFKYFDNAIKRAEEALVNLKQSTIQTGSIMDAKIKESQAIVDEMAFFIAKSNKLLKNLEDIQAKIAMKEHFMQQDLAMKNNIYTQPLASNEYKPSNDYMPSETSSKRPLVTSPSTVIYSNRKTPEEERKQESKKLAIESLLEKIAEIQKRSRGNVG